MILLAEKDSDQAQGGLGCANGSLVLHRCDTMLCPSIDSLEGRDGQRGQKEMSAWVTR